MGEMTHTDRLVLAMADMHEDGIEEFSEWELTVCVWKKFPDVYGLRGFRDEYPDHKVVLNIYQKHEGGPIGKGYMVKIRKNHYKILPSCLLRAQEISSSQIQSVSGGVSILPDVSWARLRRANKSTSLRHYITEGEISPDWNLAATFLEISTPSDRTGMGAGRKQGRNEENANNGSVKGFRDILVHTINSDADIFRKTAAGGGGEISRNDVENIARTFNANLEKWGDLIHSIGVKGQSSLFIEEVQ